MTEAKWERHHDATHNCYYYYNSESGQTTWERPLDYVDEDQSTGDDRKSWKQYIDDSTGKPYYVNEKDNRTQWEMPHDGFIQVMEAETYGAQDKAKLDVNKANGTNVWHRYLDVKTGRPYFYNTATQLTQWHEPENFQVTTRHSGLGVPNVCRVDEAFQLYQSKKEQEKLVQMTKQTLDPQGHLAKLSSVLDRIDQNICVQKNIADEANIDCPEWQQHVDPSSQRFYYYNTLTGDRQWERPNGQVQSALADWIPAEIPNPKTMPNMDVLVDGAHYTATAKLNRLTGKYERLDREEYWDAMGVATDRSGRQMSHFFDLNTLEENRAKALIIKNQLRKKNIDWKKFKAQKKLKRQKLRNKWLLED